MLIERTDVDVGIRFFGANVAEMWVTDIWLGHWRKAGIELRGYSIRTARNESVKDTPPNMPVLLDGDGREIFVGMLPRYAVRPGGRMLPCPPYCVAASAGAGALQAGGGE